MLANLKRRRAASTRRSNSTDGEISSSCSRLYRSTMSSTTIAATLLAVISIHLASSSSHLTQPDIGSQCKDSDSICELSKTKLKVAQLETILEERSTSLESRSHQLDEIDRRNSELTAEILRLESLLNQLKNVELLPEDEAISSLENEVRSLWSMSRENNFDLHILESKAVEAEERLEDAKMKVEKMADIVTEQWIQFRHLEQALQGVQIKIVDAERELCLKKCSFFKRLPLLLDQHISRHRPIMKLYWLRVLNQINVFLSALKMYHLQLQQFVRQEIEKTQAVYISDELVFFVASGLLTLPMLCLLMMLLSLYN